MNEFLRLLTVVFAVSSSQITIADDAGNCDDGNVIQCFRDGIVQYQKGKTDSAKQLYKRACDGGIVAACTNIGGVLYDEGDIDAAKLFYQRACEMNDAVSCANMGIFSQQAKNQEAALSFFGKACDLGEGPACIRWEQLSDGICKGDDFSLCMRDAATSISPFDAQQLYVTACTAGHVPACQRVRKK